MDQYLIISQFAGHHAHFHMPKYLNIRSTRNIRIAHEA